MNTITDINGAPINLGRVYTLDNKKVIPTEVKNNNQVEYMTANTDKCLEHVNINSDLNYRSRFKPFH